LTPGRKNEDHSIPEIVPFSRNTPATYPEVLYSPEKELAKESMCLALTIIPVYHTSRSWNSS